MYVCGCVLEVTLLATFSVSAQCLFVIPPLFFNIQINTCGIDTGKSITVCACSGFCARNPRPTLTFTALI